jgi:hypothetical protein
VAVLPVGNGKNQIARLEKIEPRKDALFSSFVVPGYHERDDAKI